MIGQLNQRAVLLANTLAPDGGGGFSDAWEAFATVWMKVEPIGGDDAFGPGRLEARVRYRLTLRRRSDVAAGQRAMVGARNFHIRTVIDEGAMSQTMILLAEELA